jgi:hypothetical protein
MFVLRADYSRPAWYAGSNQWGTLQLRWMVGQAVYGCGSVLILGRCEWLRGLPGEDIGSRPEGHGALIHAAAA